MFSYIDMMANRGKIPYEIVFSRAIFNQWMDC